MSETYLCHLLNTYVHKNEDCNGCNKCGRKGKDVA